jgi:hypothetical protein
MKDKQHHALPSMTVSNQHLCIGDVFNTALWLTCAQGYPTDTTQAAKNAPDAMATATRALHSQGGSGLVTATAPHMYELHSRPRPGLTLLSGTPALSTSKTHGTWQDDHTITVTVTDKLPNSTNSTMWKHNTSLRRREPAQLVHDKP